MQASQARQILLGKRKRGAPDEVRFRPIADISGVAASDPLPTSRSSVADGGLPQP
jgi:hypothetical protein